MSLFADGVAVRQVGAEPFRIARACVDEVILVNTDEICAAIKDIFEDTRAIAEPAGALGVAGLTRWVERDGARDRVLVAIESGANLNFDRLRYIRERTETGAHAEVLLAVTHPGGEGQLPPLLRRARRAARSPSSTIATPTPRAPTSSSA